MKKLYVLLALILSAFLVVSCSSKEEKSEDDKEDKSGIFDIIMNEEKEESPSGENTPEDSYVSEEEVYVPSEPEIELPEEPEIPAEPEKLTYNLELKGTTFDDGESVKAFDPDTVVTVRAESSEEKVFLYFKDNFDRVLTNLSTYTLTMKDHTFIEAVYAEKGEGELEYNTEDGKTYYVAGIGSVSGDTLFIPESYNGKPVTKIAMTAFKNNVNLKTVYIPKTITFIGDEAFSGCTSVEYINIPATVTDFDLDSLSEFTSLKVLSLGKDFEAPLNTPSLNTVFLEEGVKKFNFNSMKFLKGVFLPDSVEEIPGDAFSGCTALERVNIPKNVKKIGKSSFNYCESLTEIKLPEGIESIGEYAFLTCGSLREINFPEGLTTINGGAFAGCNSLTSVTFPDSLTVIPHMSFMSCLSLKEINFGGYVKEIEFSAFAGCDSLVSVNFPDSLETIGSGAFSDCENLITVRLPESIHTIEEKAFEKCAKINKIIIPQHLRSLGGRAFADCTGINTVIIGANKRMSIAKSAFDGANKANLTVFYSGTQSEWQEAFGDVNAFNESTIKFQSNTNYDFESGFRYASNSDGTCHIGRIPGCEINVENLVIPEKSPDGETIVSIDEDVFWNNASLKTVTIEAPLTVIPASTFSGCENITEVKLPETVKRIEERAFNGCYALTSINLPEGLEYIGENAFERCSSLNNVTLPSTLEQIGKRAFDTCSSISEINLGENIQKVGEGAFGYCTAVTKITMSCKNADFAYNCFPDVTADVYYNGGVEGWMSLNAKSAILQKNMTLYIDGKELVELIFPEGTTEIKECAFANVKSIEKVVIPDSVKKMGNSAFNGCTALNHVELGRGLEYLSFGAFANCDTIEYIFFPIEIKSIFDTTFDNTSVPGIFYEGIVTQWGDVADDKKLSYLLNLVYYYSEEQPTNTKIKFWHYVDGKVTPW